MPWKSKRPITTAERRRLAAAVKRVAAAEIAIEKARRDLACLVVAIRRDGVTTRGIAEALCDMDRPMTAQRVWQLEQECPDR